MQKPKNIVTFFFTLFLLIGGIGVSVFLHTCEEDTVFISYFVPSYEKGNHCDDTSRDLPICCENDESEEGDDCCDDEIKRYKFGLYFFQEITTPFISLYYCPAQMVDSYSAELIGENIPIHNYANPPPKKRNVARSLIQVWTL